MELRIVVQNVGLDGLRTGTGDPEDRWPALAERIQSTGQADFFYIQGLHGCYGPAYDATHASCC
ncbi:hypothetical protein ACFV9D_05670 [Streptomyces sp. NPDC059875]|uniref:hypothetical protein n=1 Tax=unclassified Streptomyces TaxID=2593676 RepID=UPI00365372F8